MRYEIKRIGRTVELMDDLANEVLKYKDIIDSFFMMDIRDAYGQNTSESDVSNEELSMLCNEVLLTELKAMCMLPQAIEHIESNYEQWTKDIMQKISLKS